MLPCGFERLTGVECLSCGAQRSFVLLLRGDVVASLLHFAALVPLILTPVVMLVGVFRPIRVWWWIFLGVVIVGSYILRIFVV